MNIPKYWSRGVAQAGFSCWQWSDLSVDDARIGAEARAAELAGKLAAGAVLDRYAYGDRPLREEIVRTLPGAAGRDLAVVTRNVYGALVLNASGAMFIDIDFAGAPPSAAGFLGRIFGRGDSIDSREQRALQQIEAWAAARRGMGLKIYRTFAGMRCLVTNQTFDPARPESIELLRGIGSDPLYVRLCQAQACFRARLTPKPWRCGASPPPPARYPFADAAQESRFRKWQAEYERLTKEYSVCRVIRQIGPSGVHPEVQGVMALHDQLACARPDRPLA